MGKARDLARLLVNSSGAIDASNLVNAVPANGSITPIKLSNGGGELGMRNRIINGAMVVIQRGTSVSNVGQDAFGACDRWKHWAADGSETGKCTMSQSTDVPSGQGFKYSSKLQVTTTQTPASTAAYKFVQRIEAGNCLGLGFGASNSFITISFWAKAENKTGTYCVSLWFYGASSNKVIVREIALTTSWTKYTITIPTDSTQDVVAGVGTGIELGIGLMAGSSIRNGNASSDWVAGATASTFTSNQVNFYDSTSNALYVTGVQLEAGSVATPFEHRSYGLEELLCKRYYEYILSGEIPENGSYYSNWRYITPIRFTVEKRATPTLERIDQSGYPNGGGGSYSVAQARQYASFIGTSGNAQSNILHYYNFAANAEL